MAAPVDLIRSVPLFADLDRRELQSVASSFKERRFAPGETVLGEGETRNRFFVIGEGEATVSAGGQERATLGPGNYFGEIALIDEGARTATVTAASDLVAYSMTAWEFRPFVESNASIAWKLLQTVAKRLREAEARAG